MLCSKGRSYEGFASPISFHAWCCLCESHYVQEQAVNFVHAFLCRVIRAPLPWHDQMQQLAEMQEKQLFTTNTIQAQINQLWHSKYVWPASTWSKDTAGKSTLIVTHHPILHFMLQVFFRAPCEGRGTAVLQAPNGPAAV